MEEDTDLCFPFPALTDKKLMADSLNSYFFYSRKNKLHSASRILWLWLFLIYFKTEEKSQSAFV